MTALAACFLLAFPAQSYAQTEAKWRGEVEASLKAEGGWLSVAGLFWMKPGTAAIGAGATNDFVLPNRSIPDRVGTATLANGKVVIRFEEGVDATVNGQKVRAAELLSDADGGPDRVQVGSLVMSVIQRGNRIGFRLIDPEAPRRKGFKGLHWFPANPKMRIEATFVPYAKPKPMAITNVLGDVRQASCPGYATFKIGGKTCRLEAEDQGDIYFFNFRDLTCRDGLSYPAGRFLNAPKPVKGKIVLDFNRATNPPCAFTDYATCPLPPAGNDLKVAVPAGALNGHRD